MFTNLNYFMPLRRDFFKRSLFLFLLLSFSSSVLSIEKYFDRNQLPQLSQEILDESQFSYSKEVVDRILIIPVQTQRVLGLRIAEKKWLLDDAYRPLVIDKDNYLIDGHHRLDGLTELKIEKVRVLRVSATTEEVIEAFEEHRDFTPTYEPEKE